MQPFETHGTFDAAISNADSYVQALARNLRKLITDVYPHVVEMARPKQQIVGYGIGPSNGWLPVMPG